MEGPDSPGRIMLRSGDERTAVSREEAGDGRFKSFAQPAVETESRVARIYFRERGTDQHDAIVQRNGLVDLISPGDVIAERISLVQVLERLELNLQPWVASCVWSLLVLLTMHPDETRYRGNHRHALVFRALALAARTCAGYKGSRALSFVAKLEVNEHDRNEESVPALARRDRAKFLRRMADQPARAQEIIRKMPHTRLQPLVAAGFLVDAVTCAPGPRALLIAGLPAPLVDPKGHIVGPASTADERCTGSLQPL